MSVPRAGLRLAGAPRGCPRAAAGTRIAAGLAAAGLAACLAIWPPAAVADPSIFKDADTRLGEQLIAEHQCSACHTRRVGGDGSAIYKPAGRINTPGLLRGMVEYCNTELGLSLFPEEVTAIAAVLQRDHYHFGRSKPAAR